jgi:RNA recognition motif-containing protein
VESLCNRFSQFDKIVSVYIPTNRHGGSKGFGFVEYETKAEAAMNKTHRRDVSCGEFLRSGPARRRERPCSSRAGRTITTGVIGSNDQTIDYRERTATEKRNTK